MELLPPLGPHNKPNGLSKNSFQCHISAQGTQRQLSAQSTLTALSCLSSARSPQWGGTQCSAWMGLEPPPRSPKCTLGAGLEGSTLLNVSLPCRSVDGVRAALVA